MADPTPKESAKNEEAAQSAGGAAATAPSADAKTAAAASGPENAADGHAAGPPKESKIKKLLGSLKGAGKGLSIKEWIVSILTLPLAVFKGGLATKIYFLGFCLAIAMIVFSSKALMDRFLPKGPTHAAHHEEKVEEAPPNWDEKSQNIVFMNRFSTTVTSINGDITKVDIELFLEADSKPTALLIENRMHEMKEAMSGALQNQTYEELLTDAGKVKLRDNMLKAVNTRLAKYSTNSKVLSVQVSALLMD